MEITDRKTAISRAQRTYYTGKECRNGHLTYRYTSSGTCAGCVSSATYAARGALGRIPTAPYEQQNATREAIRAALAETVEFKVRAYPADFDVIKDTAAALTHARFPALSAAHVADKRTATDGEGGTYLYRISCHAADVALVRDTAIALLNAHRVDLAPRLAEIQRAIAAQVEQETPDVPEWRP